MHVQGYTLHFLASGCTRQVYDIEQLPDAVAKVMPSRRSIHWKEGYEQNEVEFEALSKLQALEGAPKIFVYEESAAFINVCGQIDFANLLVVSKLGQDLHSTQYYPVEKIGVFLRREQLETKAHEESLLSVVPPVEAPVPHSPKHDQTKNTNRRTNVESSFINRL